MNTKRLLIIGLVIAALIVLVLANVTIFEDGSFAFGSYPYTASGCLPWGICR